MAKSNRDPKRDRDELSQSLFLELPDGETREGQSSGVSVLVFGVGDEKFAIEVDHTEGVVDCPRLTPLPSPPDGMIGVTSVRGRMTLVLELGAETRQKAAKRRLILLKGDAQIGIIADRIDGIISLAHAGKRRNQRRRASDSSRTSDRKQVLPVLYSFEHGETNIDIVDVERLVQS